MKRVPHYWWDFEWDGDQLNRLIVESDDPRHPVLATFGFVNDATTAIDKAERLIADLKAGRTSPKRLATA